ncbi:hypothetical protein [Daejeonella sp. JGW-45]|uniref:hypothetical protein n=1 Tax=Daejeonella sp. JGW-45 TaxID=3034148 RepID=UPI0023ED2CAA|nr:hypothetical protein [Daejeonella sp. JGW-45]
MNIIKDLESKIIANICGDEEDDNQLDSLIEVNAWFEPTTSQQCSELSCAIQSLITNNKICVTFEQESSDYIVDEAVIYSALIDKKHLFLRFTQLFKEQIILWRKLSRELIEKERELELQTIKDVQHIYENKKSIKNSIERETGTNWFQKLLGFILFLAFLVFCVVVLLPIILNLILTPMR